MGPAALTEQSCRASVCLLWEGAYSPKADGVLWGATMTRAHQPSWEILSAVSGQTDGRTVVFLAVESPSPFLVL